MAFPCLAWLAAMSAAVICGLLASGTAAFTNPIPIGDRGAVSVAPLPAGTVRVIAAGSMADWQIALIAVAAAPGRGRRGCVRGPQAGRPPRCHRHHGLIQSPRNRRPTPA
jgi:hypothetical protein